EDHRRAVLGGETIDLVVQERPNVLPLGHVHSFLLLPHGRHLLLVDSPVYLTAPELDRNVIRNAIKPTGQRFPLADGAGLARQDEKGCLESIIGVVLVVKDLPADAKDQGSMPFDQGRESRLFFLVNEPLEQGAVRRIGRRRLGYQSAN